LEFYHKRNIDTISFAVGPHHVLRPELGLKQMEKVLAYVSEGGSTEVKEPSAIVFHHFSVGGFLYGQALLAMDSSSNSTENQKSFPVGLIKGQIFDSPPDFMNIPKGIAKSMGMGPVAEFVVERVARAYLTLTHNTSGVLHRYLHYIMLYCIPCYIESQCIISHCLASRVMAWHSMA
jgi:hypothetical protein